MSDSVFSPSWYRVAQLRPRLRDHARLYAMMFREFNCFSQAGFGDFLYTDYPECIER